MTYTKPSDVTYTQMCIWIDKNAYTVGFDEEKMYMYLYHIACMLAKKRNYFRCAEDYDKFSLMCASKFYLRLVNPKQFDIDSNGSTKLPRIKSILNYAKKVLPLYKVDYLREQVYIDGGNTEVIYTPAMELGEYIEHEAPLFDSVDFGLTLGSVPEIVRSYLSRIPRKENSAEWTNIYLSCVLTLIKMTTPSPSDEEILKQDVLDSDVVERVYRKLKDEEPVLFRLDESMRSYVKTLVNEIKHCISAELSWKTQEYISSDTSLKNIIIASMGEDIGED